MFTEILNKSKLDQERVGICFGRNYIIQNFKKKSNVHLKKNALHNRHI